MKEYSTKLDVNKKRDFDLDYTPFDIYNLNKAIWFDNYKWDPSYVLFQRFNKSKIEELNTMNDKFLYMINKYWYNFIEDYVKRKVAIAKPYFILKYRIVNIWTSKDPTESEIMDSVDEQEKEKEADENEDQDEFIMKEDSDNEDALEKGAGYGEMAQGAEGGEDGDF